MDQFMIFQTFISSQRTQKAFLKCQKMFVDNEFLSNENILILLLKLSSDQVSFLLLFLVTESNIILYQ